MTYSNSNPPPLSLPSLDGIELRRVAGGLAAEPEYLDYDIKGRGWMERTVSSTGWGYGLVSGAVVGVFILED